MKKGWIKTMGFQNVLNLSLFFTSFIFSSLFLSCKYVHVWRKDALVGWVKSSRMRTREKRNMEEHEKAGLGPQRWPRTQEIMFTKKHLKLSPSMILQGPDDIRKNKS